MSTSARCSPDRGGRAAARARQDAAYDEVRDLADAGFGALRLPVEEGGGGLTLVDFFALLVELAAETQPAADLAKHLAFVRTGDDRAGRQERPLAQVRRRRCGCRRRLVERGNKTFQDTITELTATTGGWRLNGLKYYSTGSNFADWISVTADARATRTASSCSSTRTVRGWRWRTTGPASDSARPAVARPGSWTSRRTRTRSTRSPNGRRTRRRSTSWCTSPPGRDRPGRLRDAVARCAHAPAPTARAGRVTARGRPAAGGIGRVGALVASAEAAVARTARALDVAAEAAIEGADEAVVSAA